MTDLELGQIASAPASSVEEVTAVLNQLDSALPDGDGLKWFNLLYLKVTEAILEETVDHAWADPQWLTRLDVIFAGLLLQGHSEFGELAKLHSQIVARSVQLA